MVPTLNRLSAAVVTLAWGALWANPSAARAEVDECVDAAAQELGARVERRELAFLLPGEPAVFTHRYAGEGCVAFLAVSRPSQDLDLQVLASSGLELARDTAQRAWAYASHCGVAGQRVHLSVRSHTRGRFAFAVLSGAPPERPDLGRRVGACFAGEPGRAEAPSAHALTPTEDPLGPLLEGIVRDQGWPTPAIQHGRLREGRGSVRLGVEAGRCYLVVARSTDPTLFAEAWLANERWRSPPHRRAILRGCPTVDGELEVGLGGRGDAAYAIAVASLPLPADAPANGAGAAALAVLAESAGGASAVVVRRVHLTRGERITLDHAPAAPCVSLSAIPASGDLADVRLRVVGGPHDASPDPESTVHVCVEGPLRLEVSAIRGAGTAWVLEHRP